MSIPLIKPWVSSLVFRCANHCVCMIEMNVQNVWKRMCTPLQQEFIYKVRRQGKSNQLKYRYNAKHWEGGFFFYGETDECCNEKRELILSPLSWVYCDLVRAHVNIYHPKRSPISITGILHPINSAYSVFNHVTLWSVQINTDIISNSLLK